MTDPPGDGHSHSGKRLVVGGGQGGSSADGDPTDAEAGDRELRFEDVWDEHFDFTWRSLRRLGVRPDSVDDALQDVFFVVHRRLADFEGRSAVRTWLFGIALRVARSYRRKAARSSVLDPLGPELSADASQRPDAITESNQAKVLVDAFLESLDEDKRDVFILAELEEWTAPEIAESLGIRVNTVYSRLRAARKQFEQAVRRHRAKEARVES